MENSLQAKTYNTLAIVSLFLSLLIFIPLTGLAGLVVGIIALAKISKCKKELTGQGLAIAGTIIGGIRTVLLLVLVIGFFAGLIGPGIQSAKTEALEVQAASNLRQTGIALYAYAKNHEGNLPEKLSELNDAGYIDDASIGILYDNFQQGYFCGDKNLYRMAEEDILIKDTKYNINLYANGSVGPSHH